MQNKSIRVRQNDIDEAIYRPDADVQGQEPDYDFGKTPERDVTVYTIFGKHDFLDGEDNPCLGDISDEETAEDRDLALAKAVSINGGHTQYYVRRASDGRFFNPFGMDGGRHNKHLHHAGRREFEYVSVNKRAFTFYLNFLRTKNPAHLRNAERESF